MMDVGFYFGKAVAKRLRAPYYTRKGVPVFSDTVESFYYNIWDRFKAGKPFIYVLDSENALSSEAARKKFGKQKKAAEDDQDSKGSFGDGKAKYHSEHLRDVVSELRRTGSILLIVSQTRDNLGFGFEKKTRSGGRALKFYATLEIWTSVAGKIKKRVNGRDRTIGIECLAEVKKNRVSGKVGKDRAAIFPILYDLGIDDVGSNVDFLIEEGHWRRIRTKDEDVQEDEGKGKKLFDAHDILFDGSRDAIVRHIENEGLEEKVRSIVGNVWLEIEDACNSNRKMRYL